MLNVELVFSTMRKRFLVVVVGQGARIGWRDSCDRGAAGGRGSLCKSRIVTIYFALSNFLASLLLVSDY